MTRLQAKGTTDILNNLVVAITVGAGGDLVVVGTRTTVDLAGLLLAGRCFGLSFKLTGDMGGTKL